jgi:hypothetical protein
MRQIATVFTVMWTLMPFVSETNQASFIEARVFFVFFLQYFFWCQLAGVVLLFLFENQVFHHASMYTLFDKTKIKKFMDHDDFVWDDSVLKSIDLLLQPEIWDSGSFSKDSSQNVNNLSRNLKHLQNRISLLSVCFDTNNNVKTQTTHTDLLSETLTQLTRGIINIQQKDLLLHVVQCFLISIQSKIHSLNTETQENLSDILVKQADNYVESCFSPLSETSYWQKSRYENIFFKLDDATITCLRDVPQSKTYVLSPQACYLGFLEQDGDGIHVCTDCCIFQDKTTNII